MNRLKLLYLNATFYVSFLLFSVVAIPCLSLFVAAASLLLSRRATLRRFRRAISWYGWVIIHILPFPLIRVRYRDCSARKAPGPYLFVCNHRSASDPFLMACLPHEVVQVVKAWPMHLPVLGWFARGAGYLSINEIAVEEFFAKAAKLLADGVSIASFPEGTRSGDRRMGTFHGTVFRLALNTRAPIVPLCISGNERIPPRGSLALQSGTIRIHRLTAIEWQDYKDLSPFALKTHVQETMDRELARMDGEDHEDRKAPGH